MLYYLHTEVNCCMNSNNFGSCLRDIRRLRKYTQEEISAKLNMSRQAYANYEQGRCIPTIRMLLQMSQALNYNLLIFFISENFKPTPNEINIFQQNRNHSNYMLSEEYTLCKLYSELSPMERIRIINDMIIRLEETKDI